MGRPLLYKTTDEFLKFFGLNKISDLPQLEEIEEILKEQQEARRAERAAETDDSEAGPDSSPENGNGNGNGSRNDVLIEYISDAVENQAKILYRPEPEVEELEEVFEEAEAADDQPPGITPDDEHMPDTCDDSEEDDERTGDSGPPEAPPSTYFSEN
jgi:hypothetical protein